MSLNVNRRDFLRVMGLTGAGAGAALSGGCYPRSPGDEHLNSRLAQPPEQTPGEAIHYASTWPTGSGVGVVARTREGRVVKLEGNPDHPLSGGALSGRGQAETQGLYHPERLAAPMTRDADGELQPISWAQALATLGEWLGGSSAWLTGEIADSDADLIALFAEATGGRAPVNLRLAPEAPLAKAAQDLLGFNGVPEYHFDRATQIVSVGADFLETWGSPVNQATEFAQMHSYRDHRGDGPGKAAYAGPRQSNTASACDEWIRLAPGREAHALRVLLAGILESARGDQAAAAESILADWSAEDAERAVGAEAAAKLRHLGEELAHADGPLVVASAHGPDGDLAQALALLATHVAGGSGRTISFPAEARDPRGESHDDVMRLLRQVQSGEVDVLLVHSANPVYLLPGAAEALEAAQRVVYFGTQHDETADLADLILPIHHWLESWGDHTAKSGAVGVIQPCMQPVPRPDRTQFFDTRPFAEILLEAGRILGAAALPWDSSEAYVQQRLAALHQVSGSGVDVAEFIREAKRTGVVTWDVGSVDVSLGAGARLGQPVEAESGLLLWSFPHIGWYDGSGADKPWLLEVPETSSAVVWNSWAEVHPTTAEEMGLSQGDAVALARGGKEITLPVLILRQTMPGVVCVPIGQGHTALGQWASGRGANPLRLASTPDGGRGLAFQGLAVTPTAVSGGGDDLVRTTWEQDQRGRHIARAVPLDHAEDPEFWHRTHEQHYDWRNLDSMYGDDPRTGGHTHEQWDWSMAIDLDACNGCNACVVACHAENNVPVVGADNIRMGREMAWINIQKYHGDEGADSDDTRLVVGLCQQCHSAPCEPVCPVHAAYHTHEGLNAQVYNRCVGTRYCSNNCTYKVRRFNWFDYTVEEPLNLLYNPDVTVRERGVMEKCTFCVQRIHESRRGAASEEREVRDGEIQPACAQTCPAKAISFGNFLDESSEVKRRSDEARGYALLGDLGTRPSVTYLKKVLRDPESIAAFNEAHHLGHGADGGHTDETQPQGDNH